MLTADTKNCNFIGKTRVWVTSSNAVGYDIPSYRSVRAENIMPENLVFAVFCCFRHWCVKSANGAFEKQMVPRGLCTVIYTDSRRWFASNLMHFDGRSFESVTSVSLFSVNAAGKKIL